jgi:preprotein translocase subunit SecE
MAKDKAVAASGFGQIAQELLQVGIYKRSQGRIARQVTCLVIWIVMAIGAYRLYTVGNLSMPYRYVIPAAVLVVGAWFGYRIVNYPPFADFLIAVEAEMNKVTWPTSTELVRSSVVVIVLIAGLTTVLFGYDTVWSALLKYILQVTK